MSASRNEVFIETVDVHRAPGSIEGCSTPTNFNQNWCVSSITWPRTGEQDNVLGKLSTDSQNFFSPLNHLCCKLGVFKGAVKTKHILRFPIRHLVDPIVNSCANIVKKRRLVCILTLSDLNHSLVASLNPGISLGVRLSDIELIQDKFLHLSTSSMLLILSASGSLTSITTKIETSCPRSYRWSIMESDL